MSTLAYVEISSSDVAALGQGYAGNTHTRRLQRRRMLDPIPKAFRSSRKIYALSFLFLPRKKPIKRKDKRILDASAGTVVKCGLGAQDTLHSGST